MPIDLNELRRLEKKSSESGRYEETLRFLLANKGKAFMYRELSKYVDSPVTTPRTLYQFLFKPYKVEWITVDYEDYYYASVNWIAVLVYIAIVLLIAKVIVLVFG